MLCLKKVGGKHIDYTRNVALTTTGDKRPEKHLINLKIHVLATVFVGCLQFRSFDVCKEETQRNAR